MNPLMNIRDHMEGPCLTGSFLGPAQVARPSGAAGPPEHRAGGAVVVAAVLVGVQYE